MIEGNKGNAIEVTESNLWNDKNSKSRFEITTE